MTLLLALALLCPAKAAQIEVPALPQVTRLVVEAVPDARGWAMLTQEQEAALKTAVEASGGAARLIRSDGPSAIFEARSFIEAQPAAVPALKAALAPTGLKVSALHEALEAFHQAAPAAVPQDDAALQAAAARLMDGSRPLEDRTQDLGSFVQLLSANPRALDGRSEAARRDFTRALFNAAVPVVEAFNAVRGDQNYAARKAWRAANPGQLGGMDLQLFLHAELQKPENKAPVEPIRALVKRTGRAIQAAGSDVAVPLLLELLPHADHAVREDLSRRPNAARRLARDYLAMLERNIVTTRDLLLELATAPASQNDDIRVPTHSGGVASMDVPKVSGHRVAVWAYRVSDWFFDLGDLHHTVIALLGTSPEAADELKAGLPALIARAGPLISEISSIQRETELARVDAEMAPNAKVALAKDPSRAAEIAELRQLFTDHRMKQWDEHNTVEGHELLDRAVRTLGWFGPYDHLTPGFDEDAYISNVASILRAATATAGLGMFKLVAQCSLRFVEEVRRQAWPRLIGTTKDEVDGLERSVRARAGAESLKLLP